jgi:hypothetical protein
MNSKVPSSSSYAGIAQVDISTLPILLSDASTTGVEVDVTVTGLASHDTFKAKTAQPRGAADQCASVGIGAAR